MTETTKYEPPDIAYINQALDGFARYGGDARMVMPHIPIMPWEDHVRNPKVEQATAAMVREVPKLIEELAIYKREAEQNEKAMRLIAMCTDPMESSRLAGDALRRAYDRLEGRRRAVYRLVMAGTMMSQDDP